MTSAAAQPVGVGQPESLRTRAVRAGGFRIAAYILVKVIRLASGVVLARLLSPAAFGVVALAESIIRGLNMFSEVGIGPAIIRSRRHDPAFLNTAWTMQAGRGCVLAAVAAALAWPMSRVYDEPMLMWILPVIGLTVLVQGLNSTSYFTLNRTLSEGRRSLLDFSRAVVTRGSMLGLAWLVWPNAWSLVIGTMVGAVFFMVMTHVVLPGHRNRPGWDRGAAKELTSFGVWIFVGTVIAFFGQQSDRLLLGKLEALEMLGVYAIAQTVAMMPNELVGVLGHAVLFPVLSQFAREDPARFGQRLLRVRRNVLRLGMVATLGTALAAPLFFDLLYTQEYAAAAWIAPLACLTSWVAMLNTVPNRALLALGKTRAMAFTGLLRFLGTVVFCLLGAWIGRGYGLAVAGFVIGAALGLLCQHIAELCVLARHGVSLFRQDLVASACLLTLGGVGWLVDVELRGIDPLWVQVVCRAGSAGLICGLCALATLRPVWTEFRRR